MNQREKDVEAAPGWANQDDFADGAAYARKEVAQRIAAIIRVKHVEVRDIFDDLETLIQELEAE